MRISCSEEKKHQEEEEEEEEEEADDGDYHERSERGNQRWRGQERGTEAE